MAELFFPSFFSVFSLPIVLSLIGVFVLLAIIAFIKSSDSEEKPKTKVELQYRAVSSVFDKREVVLFQELKRQLPEGYHIFPKMRLADIMETTATGKDSYGQFNRISKKHIDFLICDSFYKPVLAIELNGSSHKTVRAQKSDEFKKKAFKNIGIRLEVVEVGSDFASEVGGLLNSFSLDKLPKLSGTLALGGVMGK